MSAQPVHEPDPDDPVEILRVLPGRFHDQFLAEYYEAAGEVISARMPSSLRLALRAGRPEPSIAGADGSICSCRRRP
jgi:hypothetical protein